MGHDFFVGEAAPGVKQRPIADVRPCRIAKLTIVDAQNLLKVWVD